MARLPARLQRLLWVLCLNAALFAVEANIQRLDGTTKLLWLVEPRWNKDSDSQFGPYAYRSNAAQYFNLVWPVCLGFWWMLRRSGSPVRRGSPRIGSGPQILLLPCVVLLAASPIISLARGGAIIATMNLVLGTILLIFADSRRNNLRAIGIFVVFLASLALVSQLGWDKLEKRFETVFSDKLSLRTEIYENAQQIARDFPVFGTGPGSFSAMYQFYRKNPEQEWQAYLHDDWLEARVTFGWVGFAFIGVSLVLLLKSWWARTGVPAHWTFHALVYIALGGCLLHAKFDFPFQVYSVLFLFVLLAAIGFTVCRKIGP